MTSLFNLFCPLVLGVSIITSTVFMVIFSLFMVLMLLLKFNFCMASSLFKDNFLLVGSMLFMVFNLISLVCYSYPVTATLAFNFSVALPFWITSFLLILLKPSPSSVVLPMNSPWYLVPFLSLVELISIIVRPITLSFRLLANMSAGHILLSLISKMNLGLWLLGSAFGIFEMMVCLVQGFVFFMLINVYLEEGFTH